MIHIRIGARRRLIQQQRLLTKRDEMVKVLNVLAESFRRLGACRNLEAFASAGASLERARDELCQISVGDPLLRHRIEAIESQINRLLPLLGTVLAKLEVANPDGRHKPRGSGVSRSGMAGETTPDEGQ